MIHIAWGVVVACGKEEQLADGVFTAFLDLSGKPVLAYSLMAFERCPDIQGVLVVTAAQRTDAVWSIKQLYGCSKIRQVVTGTTQRTSSVMAALRALDDEATLVITHDASRPLIQPETISATIKSAKRYGSGISACPSTDAIKQTRTPRGTAVKATLGPDLWVAMTPQAFRREELIRGYTAASSKRIALPDDSAALELIKQEVRLVDTPGPPIRIRQPADLKLAAALVQA